MNRVLAIGFLLVALALFYWGQLRATNILARDDNPRLVEAELSIERGRILDRHGEILALTAPADGSLSRHYPFSGIGPAVGYYSFRHGTSGIEDSFDQVLRGEDGNSWQEFSRRLMHLPQIGHDIQLTIDAQIQRDAESRLGDQPGAALLLNMPAAEILAMVSHPNYDPNLLDTVFEELVKDDSAPLLNRVTQGQYQPGMLLEPLIIGRAIDMGLVRLDDAPEGASASVEVNGKEIMCLQTPSDPTSWADVILLQCPAPLTTISRRLGAQELAASIELFGFADASPIPLETASPAPVVIDDPLLAGLGQENLVVSPLQIAVAWSAIAVDGRLTTPRLVLSIQDQSGDWIDTAASSDSNRTALSATTAQAIRRSLSLTEDIREFATVVLSGPEGTTNTWYVGMAPAGSPRYLVAVILEASASREDAITIGRSILKAAMR